MKALESYISLKDIYVANEPSGHFGWSSLILAIKEMLFFKGDYDVIQYVETPSLLHILPLWFSEKISDYYSRWEAPYWRG